MRIEEVDCSQIKTNVFIEYCRAGGPRHEFWPGGGGKIDDLSAHRAALRPGWD